MLRRLLFGQGMESRLVDIEPPGALYIHCRRAPGIGQALHPVGQASRRPVADCRCDSFGQFRGCQKCAAIHRIVGFQPFADPADEPAGIAGDPRRIVRIDEVAGNPPIDRQRHAARGTPLPGKPPATTAEIAAQFPEPARIWRINGGANAGYAGAPLFRARQGDPCVLAVTNASAWAQVIHTHGHHFRYLHPFDDGWEPYWLDTLVVPPGQTIRIAFDAGTPGKWAVRSSIMEHFESGVASWFEVS